MTASSGARIYRKAPKPLAPGACAHCGRVIALRKDGRRRDHRDTQGRRCTGGLVLVAPRAVDAAVLSEARIVLPPEPQQHSRRTRPSPTGACHRCSRPVTGERLYCGPCVVERGR